MIIKLQRAIDPPDADVLIYDQRRTITQHVEMTPGLRKMFCDRYKVFAEAEMVDGVLIIGKQTSDRGW
jgi:hypothetical protein